MHPLEDLFSVPLGGDSYLVYAPLRGIVFEANGAAVNTIASLVAGGDVQGEDTAGIRAFVESKGLLHPPTNIPADVETYAPATTLALSLTERCNLRCIYCYAGLGSKCATMPWPTAQTAISTVARNASAAGGRKLHLLFHGTGEALVAWGLLRQCVEYAEKQAATFGLEPQISLVTNGTLVTPQRARYLAEHLDRATLSFDGLPEAHNQQRPFPNGRGSFDMVLRGALALREAGLPFSIRSTITSINVHQMVEMVELFTSEVLGPGRKMGFEPMAPCGRGSSVNQPQLTATQFLTEYKKAVLRAEELRVKLRCSSDRDELRQSFCGANGRVFCVLPRGEVTGCTRVTSSTDPLANVFFYGQHVREVGFSLDGDKLSTLRTFDIDHTPACQACFCKWHCAGQCPHTRLSDSGHTEFMCTVTREIMKWRLTRKLEEKGGEVQ